MQEEKKKLRQQMKGQRAALGESLRLLKSEEILHRLKNFPPYLKAKSVFLFLSIDTEVQTKGIAADVLKRGKKLLIPHLSRGQMEAVELKSFDELVSGVYKIPSLPARQVEERRHEDGIDLIVTPGLAFDRRGFRLGYGGGFYDRFLEKHPGTPCTLGLAFDCQMVDEVFHESFDRPVDEILTESGLKIKNDGDIMNRQKK